MNRARAAFMLTSTVAIVVLVAAAVFADATPRDNMFRNLSIFTEVFSIIRDGYVEEVPQVQLVEGAFAGVTDAIDEFSYYIRPEAMEAWRKSGRDEAPRGAALSRRFGYGYVIAVLPGSAAAEAGLQSGDLVESVNGRAAAGMTAWEIRDAISRASGDVRVAVLRDGETERVTLTIGEGNGGDVEPSLSRKNGVPVIKVPAFSDGATEQLSSILARLETEETVIIDVRENATGQIDEAVAAADLFLESGTIVRLAGRRVEANEWNADGERSYTGRVIVLVDSTTAGPAEIFAGALQGNDRAEVVGRGSYGRAVEQKLIELPSGGGLWMTVGHYSGPSERYTGTKGLRPDELVDLTPLLLDRDKKRSERPDLILERAVERARAATEIEREAA